MSLRLVTIVPALKKSASNSWPTGRTGTPLALPRERASVVAPYFDGRSRLVQLFR